jgi:hypothetical protein
VRVFFERPIPGTKVEMPRISAFSFTFTSLLYRVGNRQGSDLATVIGPLFSGFAALRRHLIDTSVP